MKIAGICFSKCGVELENKIQHTFIDESAGEFSAEWFFRGSFQMKNTGISRKMRGSVAEWTRERFHNTDILIFIGACGIAVRAIAPYVRDKRHDPAVIVMDEMGRFCIPILSGHVGGANAFAVNLAEVLGSIPVVTTATDIHNKFAVDVYARDHQLTMSNATYAKEVSAAIISGEPVGFYTNFPVEGNLPDGLVWSDKLDRALQDNGERAGGVSLGIYISPSYNRAYFDHTLWLIPKCLSVGIECRKGTDSFLIEQFVQKTLNDFSLYQEAVAGVATIDLNKDEPGLVEFCVRNDLPLHCYSADELKQVSGDFSSPDFGEQVTGVDNVCERSAVLDGGGEILITRRSLDGITCSVALNHWKVEF